MAWQPIKPTTTVKNIQKHIIVSVRLVSTYWLVDKQNSNMHSWKEAAIEMI